MSERGEARRDGAKLQKNSGRGQFSKGDATWKMFLIDYKEYSKSFSVTLKEWAKVCRDAARTGLDSYPLIKVVLGPDEKKIRLGVLEWSMLEELVDKAERYDALVTERYEDG